MKIVYSPRHRAHHARQEINRGELVPAHETPERAEAILSALQSAGVGLVVPPEDFGLDPILRVHDAGYVSFLQEAHVRWTASGRSGAAIPMAWPARDMPRVLRSTALDAQLGHYSFDIGTPITAGTWDAALASAHCALTAADIVRSGEPAAFALCRPPGHHAGHDYSGGYCYLNNAAIAAQHLRESGQERVAILDVDYHHGNGTQALFYNRADVFYASIHGDPASEYPYYLGHADETGRDAGAGHNLNLPLPVGSGWPEWSAALDTALDTIAAHAPQALIVSLGVDTFAGDPISKFRLETAHFPQIGQHLAALELPTVFLMEGGYAVAAIGRNVAGVLGGFQQPDRQ